MVAVSEAVSVVREVYKERTHTALEHSVYHTLDFTSILRSIIMADDALQDQDPQDWPIWCFRQWILHNYTHVVEAMHTQGGWEVWAQLELYFAMRNFIGGNNALAREKNQIWVHSPNDRVDFWFTWGAGDGNGQPYDHWGIELKCRTAAETHANFRGRVLGDFDKCNKTPAARPTVLYVVGISYDPYDYTGYGGNWAFQGHTWYSIVSDPAGQLSDMYLVWRRFEHNT